MFRTKLDQDLNKGFLNERHIDLEKLNLVLTQDIFSVVNSYLDITPQDVSLRLGKNSEGEYELKCKVKAKRLKIVGFIK